MKKYTKEMDFFLFGLGYSLSFIKMYSSTFSYLPEASKMEQVLTAERFLKAK